MLNGFNLAKLVLLST